MGRRRSWPLQRLTDTLTPPPCQSFTSLLSLCLLARIAKASCRLESCCTLDTLQVNTLCTFCPRSPHNCVTSQLYLSPHHLWSCNAFLSITWHLSETVIIDCRIPTIIKTESPISNGLMRSRKVLVSSNEDLLKLFVAFLVVIHLCNFSWYS